MHRRALIHRHSNAISEALLSLLTLFFLAQVPLLDHDWHEIQTPHFTIVSNGKIEMSQKLAHDLEQARVLVQKVMPWTNTDPGRPVVVWGIATDAQKRKLSEWNSKVRHRGFFRPGRYQHHIVYDYSIADTSTAVHEYIHMINRHNFAFLPRWLNEGVAEVFENVQVNDGEIMLGMPHPDKVRVLRRQGIELEELLTRDYRDFSPNPTVSSHNYAQSWALVHYLILGSGQQETKGLQRFLALMSSGRTAKEAMKEFAGSPKKLERAVRGHVLSPGLPALTFDQNATLPPREYPVTYIDQTRYAARLTMLTPRGSFADELFPLLPETSEDVEVQLARVMHLKRLRHDREALSAAAKRAHELAPDSARALLIYLDNSFSFARGQAEITRKRNQYVRVIELEPNYSQGWNAYAEILYSTQGPLEQILRAFGEALRLTPSNHGVRSRVMSLMIQEGAYEQAMNYLNKYYPLLQTEEERQAARETAATLKAILTEEE